MTMLTWRLYIHDDGNVNVYSVHACKRTYQKESIWTDSFSDTVHQIGFTYVCFFFLSSSALSMLDLTTSARYRKKVRFHTFAFLLYLYVGYYFGINEPYWHVKEWGKLILASQTPLTLWCRMKTSNGLGYERPNWVLVRIESTIILPDVRGRYSVQKLYFKDSFLWTLWIPVWLQVVTSIQLMRIGRPT